MPYSRLLYLFIICAGLLLTSSCQRKGIPCPKPGKSVKVQGKGAGGLEAIKVPRDKNGRVKKRGKLL
jgi:hypothetical protein